MRRFFAPSIAILVICLSLEGLYRVVLFAAALRARSTPAAAFEFYTIGESTAAGMPYPPRLAPPFLVSRILGGSVGGRKIVVTDLAAGGESIYPQATALERALRGRTSANPGAVWIYSGHNDAHDDVKTPDFELFKERVLYRSAVLMDLFYAAEERRLIPRVRTLGTYEFHLRRVVELSLKTGLVPILSTTGSNIAGIDPGLSRLEYPTSGSFEGLLAPAERLETAGRVEDARRAYLRLSQSNPELRDYLRYRIARCELRLGHAREAAALFRSCLETPHTDNFGRSTAAQNEIVRRLAREYSIPLVDSVAIFAAHSPQGLPDDGLFIDGHHPNFRGYVLLDNAIAQALAKAFQAPPGKPLAYSPHLLDDLGASKQEQARADVAAGRWLFSVAALHLAPGQRLRMSQERFRSALAVDPASFSARFGLCLALAARQEGFVQRNIDWLDQNGFFYGEDYTVRAESFEPILRKLKEAAVPESELSALSRSYQSSRKESQ